MKNLNKHWTRFKKIIKKKDEEDMVEDFIEAIKPQIAEPPINQLNKYITRLYVEEVETNFKVFMHVGVFVDIYNHSRDDTTKELGGILVGKYCKEKSREKQITEFVNITNSIRAEHTLSTSTQLTFTQETWDYIETILEKKFADLQIVGWYHTHPGLGVFLSEHDMFIHTSFFNFPWQVALVIDPVFNKFGIFLWKKGRIIAGKGLFFYTESEEAERLDFLFNNILKK